MRHFLVFVCALIVFFVAGELAESRAVTGHSMSPSQSSSRSQISRAIAIEAKQMLDTENVIHANAENFNQYVSDKTKFSFVFFHADWSGRSNRFATEFVSLIERYSDNKDIQFILVNANDNEKLCRSWAVTTFPFAKMITRGVVETANTFYDFPNAREELPKFIDRVLLHEKFKYVKRAATTAELPGNTLVHPGQGLVAELNGETFENFTKSTKFFTFVLFYAPWCGACKEMMSDMEAVARYFKPDPKVIISRINVEDNAKLLDRYGITALPTMYMFPKARLAKRGIRYTGGRDRLDMQAIIDNQNRMQDSEEMPYIDENTDMDALMAEMKLLGRDPESLMRNYAAKSGQEYKSPDKKKGD